MTIIDEINFNSDVIDKHSKDKESFILFFSSTLEVGITVQFSKASYFLFSFSK